MTVLETKFDSSFKNRLYVCIVKVTVTCKYALVSFSKKSI